MTTPVPSAPKLPPLPLQIRPAIDADYGAIASIYNEAIAHGGITMDGQPKTADNIQATVQKMTDRERILVGEADGRVMGWGIVKRYSDRLGYRVCCETSIYLTVSAQGKGYGKQLQAAVMEQARQFNYHHIVAKILAANPGSVRFHEKFGFETVGVQKEVGFINGIWHDVVIMQCILPNGPECSQS